MSEKLYSTKELAEIFGVSHSAIKRCISNQTIKPISNNLFEIKQFTEYGFTIKHLVYNSEKAHNNKDKQDNKQNIQYQIINDEEPRNDKVNQSNKQDIQHQTINLTSNENFNDIQQQINHSTINENFNNVQQNNKTRNQKIDYEQIKEEAKSYLPNLLAELGIDNLSKNFRCINPNHNDSTPSMTYYADTHCVHCHGCGFHGDIFDVYSLVSNKPVDKAIFYEIYEKYSLIERKSNNKFKVSLKPKTAPIKPPIEAKKEYLDRSAEIAQAAKNLLQTDYWKQRGFTLETAQQFNIGYIAQWKHPDFNTPPSDRLILPTGDGIHSYLARDVRNDGDYKVLKVGGKALFNLNGLSSEYVIVNEGEFDAISTYQVGFHNVVGLGGVGNKDKFVEAVKLMENKPKFVIIALDNDEVGIKTAQWIQQELDKLGVYAPIYNSVFGTHKDANGLLKQGEELKKAMKTAIAEATEHLNEKAQSKNLPKLPDNLNFEYEAPAGYIVDLSGIYQVTAKGEQKRISKSPVIISKRIENIDDGIHKICISCCKYGRNNWKTSPAVPYSTIANKQKIVSLSDNGIDVNSNSAGKLVEYLSDFEATNIDNIPKVKAVNKCGWRDEKTFIAPYNQNEYIIDTSKNTFADALTQKGDFKAWLDVLTKIRQHNLARFITDAALATPLLYILNERSFSIYLNADSKAGKTATMKFGGSAWGNPDEVAKTFNCTINGLEVAAAMRSDFPLIINEKQLAENQNQRNRLDMTKLLYLIGEGEGKSRMDRNANERKSYKWRTICLANGETTIISDETTQGAITRTLIFNVSDKVLPTELSNEIYKIMKHNYGHAGQIFIDELLKEDFNELRDVYNDMNEAAHQKFTKHIDDHIRYVVLISLADFLVNKYFYKADEETAIEEASNLAISILGKLQTQEELSDIQREWDFVANWIVENDVNFLGSRSNTGETLKNVKIYGDDNDPDYLFIITNSLKAAAEKAGFNYLKLVKDLKKAGYVVSDKGDKNSIAHRINGKSTRCLKIAKSKMENE